MCSEFTFQSKVIRLCPLLSIGWMCLHRSGAATGAETYKQTHTDYHSLSLWYINTHHAWSLYHPLTAPHQPLLCWLLQSHSRSSSDSLLSSPEHEPWPNTSYQEISHTSPSASHEGQRSLWGSGPVIDGKVCDSCKQVDVFRFFFLNISWRH